MTELSGLYAITDAGLIAPEHFPAAIRAALCGGAKIIQYRDKSNDREQRFHQATIIQALCKQHGALLIINDDVELARDVDADGVHIGLDDRPIQDARTILGRERIIGVSCYNQLTLAEQAAHDGADYIAFGSFFNSPTKPRAVNADVSLLQAARRFDVPLCAIGGITLENASALIDAGADMVAVISAVFGSEDIELTCHQFKQLFS